MKLEMRTHDLDINVEIKDNEGDNHLAVLEAIKKLVDSLLYCEDVSISITSVNFDSEESSDEELLDADPQ